jgi:hypothetical protein
VTARSRLGSVVAALVCVALAWTVAGGRAEAEVDPRAGTGPVAWGASCLLANSTQRYTVYGRDWVPGQPLAISINDTNQQSLASTSAIPVAQPDRGGTFQASLDVAVPGPPTDVLFLDVFQSAADRSVSQQIGVRGSCTPTISAKPLTTCTKPGQAVPIEVTGGSWPPRSQLKHYIDLYGPSERIDRTNRDAAAYSFTLNVDAAAGTVVAVTGEGTLPSTAAPSFTYATAYVAMPAACAPPSTPAPTTTATTRPVTTTVPAVTTTFPITLPLPTAGTARIVVTPPLGRPGETVRVQGSGFPPSAPVILRWQPGSGQWAVTAGPDGTFDTRVLVLPKDTLGRRALQPFSSVGVTAVPYLVVPATEAPAGFDASVFLRG